MYKIDRRKFIKKSALGIASIGFLVNIVSCIDDEISIKEETIKLPNKIYLVKKIQKKEINFDNYKLNDESKIELLLTGFVVLKSLKLISKLQKKGFYYEDFDEDHYKVYFNEIIKYDITKNLNENITIHYILEDSISINNKNIDYKNFDNNKINFFKN